MSATMSLRLRFILLPLVVVVAGLAGFSAFQAWNARARVQAEVQAGAKIGRLVAAGAIAHAASAPTPQEALDGLIRELPPAVGDLRLTVEGVGQTTSLRRREATQSPAPEWFKRLVAAPPLVERYPVVIAEGQVGSVVLKSRANQATTEAWNEWRRQVAAIGLLSAVIILAIVIASALALIPLDALSRAFDRLERGDLTTRVKPRAGGRMRRLAERFNRLADLLEEAEEERRRLVDEMTSGQDADRKDVARELHEGYAQPFFAIRSELGALSRLVRRKEPRFEEMEERLLAISSLVAQIQRLNSQLVDRLRG